MGVLLLGVLVVRASDERVPLTVLIAGPIVATFFFGLVRFQSRLFAFRRFGDRDGPASASSVVGAGQHRCRRRSARCARTRRSA